MPSDKGEVVIGVDLDGDSSRDICETTRSRSRR